jgi:hypothetical protein
MAILNRAFESTCKYVAEHPVESVGLALVAAYLVSRLTP